MNETANQIEDAIFLHNTHGYTWEQVVLLTIDEKAVKVVEAIRDGLFTDNEIDTFTAKQFEEKVNRIRIEREVFGAK